MYDFDRETVETLIEPVGNFIVVIKGLIVSE
jgi:hypothetical protein